MPIYKERSAVVSLLGLFILLVTTVVVLSERFTTGGEFTQAHSLAPQDLPGQQHASPSPQRQAGRVSPGPSQTVNPAASTVTISGVGDVTMGNAPGKLPSRDASGFFQNVKSALKADIVTGNLDTTLTNNTEYVKCPQSNAQGNDCYAFRVPPSYAKELKAAGFNVINLANNHTLDYGYPGLKDTKEALLDNGVEHTGMPGQVTLLRIPTGESAITVATVGFSSYAWGAKVTDIPAAKKLVTQAAEQADVVVVHMQAGAEGADKNHVKPGTEIYLGENRGDVQTFSHAVIDAGADLVIGHGPHVLRGMEWYKDRLIAYSLGNFASYQTANNDGTNSIGAILKVSLHADGSWKTGKLIATALTASGLPGLDSQNRAYTVVDRLSGQDFGKQAVGINTKGEIQPPGN